MKEADSWRIPGELWQQLEPLLPPRPPPPLGCHNPRVPDRSAMNAILLVLRTGHAVERRERNSYVLVEFGLSALLVRGATRGCFWSSGSRGCWPCDALHGIDWDWLAMEGAMTKAPLGKGGKTGANPTDRGKGGPKRSTLTDAAGIPPAVEVWRGPTGTT